MYVARRDSISTAEQLTVHRGHNPNDVSAVYLHCPYTTPTASPFVSLVSDHPSNKSAWLSSTLTGETFSQISRFTQILLSTNYSVCSVEHDKTLPQSKGKPHGYSYSCQRHNFVGALGVFVRVWHLKAWRGKEPTDNGSFSALVYQGDAAAEGF